jgi:FkbM family methyltransferase
VHVEVSGKSAEFYVHDSATLEKLSRFGGEEHLLAVLIRSLRDGDTFYDIGAEVGLYALLLSQAVGMRGLVVAFEPDDRLRERLEDNRKLNRRNNIRVFGLALSDYFGRGKLLPPQGRAPKLDAEINGVETRGELTVDVTSGDRLVEMEHLPLPAAVKIDVEGQELSVLRGLRRTLSKAACQMVCCEVHPSLLPAGVGPPDVLDLLRSLGFDRIDTFLRPPEQHLVAYKGSGSLFDSRRLDRQGVRAREGIQLGEDRAVDGGSGFTMKPVGRTSGDVAKSNMTRRILVGAYACLVNPGSKFPGGGDAMGWNLVTRLSRHYQSWVLTSAQNRPAIEAALEEEPFPDLHFEYVDLPGGLRRLQRFQGGVQFFAYLWQWKAYFVARRLHRHIGFNAFHQLSYSNDWMASIIGALLPVLYLRGPCGGAHRTPKAFVREYPVRERMWERVRAIGQWLLRRDPFFVLGQRRAKAILLGNQEALAALPARLRPKAQLFPLGGVPKAAFEDSPRPPTHKDGFQVLTAGRLVRLKAFDLAVRAFSQFVARLDADPPAGGAQFTIIGEGPELGRLRELASKLGLARQVAFENWMPRHELWSRMRTCDVFLFPSLRDGGSLAVVEAMAAGKPVICVDLGGSRVQVTEQCGIKVKPGSPKQVVRDLATALGTLYRDEEGRLRMGRAARERAEQVYSWDRLGDRLLAVYRDVLEDHPESAPGDCVREFQKEEFSGLLN